MAERDGVPTQIRAWVVEARSGRLGPGDRDVHRGLSGRDGRGWPSQAWPAAERSVTTRTAHELVALLNSCRHRHIVDWVRRR